MKYNVKISLDNGELTPFYCDDIRIEDDAALFYNERKMIFYANVSFVRYIDIKAITE